MSSRTHVSVDAISPAQRLLAWRDLVSTHVGRTPEPLRGGDPAQWEPLAGQPFSASLEYGMLGHTGLCRLVATPHRFTRSSFAPSPGTSGPLMVVVQQKARSFFEQDGRAGTLAPGDWCVVDAARPFVIDHPAGCDQIIMIPPRPADPDVVDLIARARSRRCNGHQGASRLVNTLLSEAYGQFDRLPPSTAGQLADAIASMAWHALQEACETPAGETQSDTLRNRLKAFIDTHLADPDLSVEAVARGCGCSVRSVHRAFAEDALGSVSAYIWHRRVAQCAGELRNPAHAARSVTDIAMGWGFASSSHFSRLFRRTLGVSPKTYRHAQ